MAAQTPIYGFPIEEFADAPGSSLYGGVSGTGDRLAESVETELARVEADVESASNPVPLDSAEVTVGTLASLELTIPLLDLHSVRIVGFARGNVAGDFAGLRLTLNDVGSGSYFAQRHRIIDTAIDATILTGQDSWNAGTVAGDNMPSTALGAVDILLTSLQTQRTLMHAETSAMTGGSGALWRTETNKGFSTVETVATVQLFPASGEWMVGTRFELWPA